MPPRVIRVDFGMSAACPVTRQPRKCFHFYALCDEQLDPAQDAYAGILGPTALDREVAKFWINASFGNSGLLTKWSKKSVRGLQERLVNKGYQASTRSYIR